MYIKGYILSNLILSAYVYIKVFDGTHFYRDIFTCLNMVRRFSSEKCYQIMRGNTMLIIRKTVYPCK